MAKEKSCSVPSADSCSPVNYRALFLRLALGSVLFAMGVGKISAGAEGFVTQMAASFEGGWLPMGLVTLWLSLIPYAEVVLGLALFFGIYTQVASYLAALFFVFAGFGLAASGQVQGIPYTLIYLYGTLWLSKCPYSSVSVDRWLGCKSC